MEELTSRNISTGSTTVVSGGRDIGFRLLLPDRSTESSQAKAGPIIERWILPGLRIKLDAWAAFADIDQICGGIYDVVGHQKMFVATGYGTEHKLNIGNTWYRSKRKLRRAMRDVFSSFPVVPVGISLEKPLKAATLLCRTDQYDNTRLPCLTVKNTT